MKTLFEAERNFTGICSFRLAWRNSKKLNCRNEIKLLLMFYNFLLRSESVVFNWLKLSKDFHKQKGLKVQIVPRSLTARTTNVNMSMESTAIFRGVLKMTIFK